ncbi:Glial Lazarillo [Carabus blaptoides fortunei]
MAVLFKFKCFLIVLAIFVLNQNTCVFGYGLGSCPKYNLMKNFNITRFMGHWYEIERSFYLLELTAGCTTIELQENLDGKIEVVARVINKWTGGESTSEGIAVISKRNPSILKYKVNSALPTAIARLLPGAGFYQVLHTDYNNFAILWTCSNLLLAHADQVWILGRKREISVPLRAQIYKQLSNLRIDSDRLIISKNANCPENE